MRSTYLAAGGAALLLLSACSSSAESSSSGSAAPASAEAATSSAAPSSSAPASSAPASSAPAASASPTATEPLSCADFAMAAAHVTSRIEVLGIDNGTENDVVPVFEQLNEALGVMTSMAANEEAILAVVKVGRSTWKALKINRVGWDGY